MRVVDLSGPFRFHNPETFAQWYKLPAPRANWPKKPLRSAGTLCHQLPGTRLVANPAVTDQRDSWMRRSSSPLDPRKTRHRLRLQVRRVGAGKEPKRELHFVEWTKICAPTDCFRTGTRRKYRSSGIDGDDIVSRRSASRCARHSLNALRLAAEAAYGSGNRTLFRKFYADRPMMPSGRWESPA